MNIQQNETKPHEVPNISIREPFDLDKEVRQSMAYLRKMVEYDHATQTLLMKTGWLYNNSFA